MNSTPSPLEAALSYAARGWPVLPLHTPVDVSPEHPSGCDCRKECDNVGKHPRTRDGVKGSSLDPDQIRKWWGMWPAANVGADLVGARLLSIAPDSPAWHAEFLARTLPETATFVSGGGDGHQHWLYAMPEGVAQRRLCRSGEYDVLSAGYIVMPPSMHKSGRRYAWVADITPIEPPPWACGMLNDRPKVQAVSSEAGEVIRDEAFNRLLESVDQYAWNGVATERSGGLWAIAKELYKAGANAATIRYWVEERDVTLGWNKYQGRRAGQYSYGELVREASAEAAGETPRITSVHGSNGRPESTGGRVSFDDFARTVAQFMNETPEQVDWLVKGLLARGAITELDAKVKAGKTELAVHMVRAICGGDPSFLGMKVNQARALYLTEQATSFRQSLARARLDDREDAWVVPRYHVARWEWPRIVEQAVEFCLEHDVGLLVVDTLSKFAKLKDENDATEAMKAMEPLQQAITRGLAVMVLRHDRKSGGELGDSARGSSAFGGDADIILSLRHPSGANAAPRRRELLGIGRYSETPERLLIELTPDLEYISISHARESNESELLQSIGRDGTGRDHRRLQTEVLNEVGGRKQSRYEEIARLRERGMVGSEGGLNPHDPRWLWVIDQPPPIRLHDSVPDDLENREPNLPF